MRVVLVVLSLAAAGFLFVQERGASAAADIQKVALSGERDPTPQEVTEAREQVKTATKLEPRHRADRQPRRHRGPRR